MRILFVVDYIGDDYLGIMGISSILKQKGYYVESIDAKLDKIIEKLKDKVPTVLAYSVSTSLAKQYLHINKVIKKQIKVFSVFGGPHPTAVPEIIEEEGVDAVCMGEGDYAMLELIDNLSAGRPITNIKNWWVKENEMVFKNSLRPLISDLDNLPFPDRSLFEGQDLFNRRKMHIMTGRGCPNACDYCFNSYYNKLYTGQWGKVRKRSVYNVIEEIHQFKKRFPLKFIVFDDAIFSLPYEWLKKFSLEYRKHVHIPFSCNIHVEYITDEAISYLKKAGCFSISMGIETANEYIRSDILGRKVSKEQILKTARLVKQYNIRLRTSNIINIPYGSMENDFETLKLNIECNTDYAGVFFLEAFPKTKINSRINTDGRQSYLYLSLLNSCQKIHMENLRNLFALVVVLPFLFPYMKALIRLPLSRVYKLFYLLWEGYCAYFYLYPVGIMGFFRGVKKYMRVSGL